MKNRKTDRYPYRAERVDAIYRPESTGNPYIDAMPELEAPENFHKLIYSKPPLPSNLSGMSNQKRLEAITDISSAFFPMDFMYQVYLQMYRSIISTYKVTQTADETRRVNSLYFGRDDFPRMTQVESGAILGTPGVGKTATIRRCLSVMPQVISHVQYGAQPLIGKQVLYLYVECPSDCSIKALAFNFISALDNAIGTSYLPRLSRVRTLAVSALITQVKILCVTHHVGLLVVDEIQNAVLTARNSGRMKPLIRFLVELTNDACSSVYFIGTPAAEELFCSEEHLRRRTRGLRLTPMKPDGTYYSFLKRLWELQYTQKSAPLTERMANKIYDCTGGIPAYIVKVFQEAQVQAILRREPAITEKMISAAVDALAIVVPRTFAKGVSISEEIHVDEPMTDTEGEVPRDYAKKRGRRPQTRDEHDIVAAFKRGEDVKRFLEAIGSIEVISC